METLSSSAKEKSSKRTVVPKIGRSAATGQFVLKPVATKGGKITQKQANNAVKLVSVEKK
jgi:hypothetical protein